jgi:hypothetical protein
MSSFYYINSSIDWEEITTGSQYDYNRINNFNSHAQ